MEAEVGSINIVKTLVKWLNKGPGRPEQTSRSDTRRPSASGCALPEKLEWACLLTLHEIKQLQHSRRG